MASGGGEGAAEPTSSLTPSKKKTKKKPEKPTPAFRCSRDGSTVWIRNSLCSSPSPPHPPPNHPSPSPSASKPRLQLLGTPSKEPRRPERKQRLDPRGRRRCWQVSEPPRALCHGPASDAFASPHERLSLSSPPPRSCPKRSPLSQRLVCSLPFTQV